MGLVERRIYYSRRTYRRRKEYTGQTNRGFVPASAGRSASVWPDTGLYSEKRKAPLVRLCGAAFRLVPGTVGDQVSLFDSQVTDTQIWQALDMVGLGKTIENLPDGIHTPCTESLFSQEQFQLLAIARAVVLNPKILLLDEITANLDSQTEEMVISALQTASQNRTVISVSHRLYAGEKNRRVRFLTL